MTFSLLRIHNKIHTGLLLKLPTQTPSDFMHWWTRKLIRKRDNIVISKNFFDI